jgi:hypothetical protein
MKTAHKILVGNSEENRNLRDESADAQVILRGILK